MKKRPFYHENNTLELTLTGFGGEGHLSFNVGVVETAGCYHACVENDQAHVGDGDSVISAVLEAVTKAIKRDDY